MIIRNVAGPERIVRGVAGGGFIAAGLFLEDPWRIVSFIAGGLLLLTAAVAT